MFCRKNRRNLLKLSREFVICIRLKCFRNYHKIPKISPGAYIFQRPYLRGLFLEEFLFGGALIVGRKFTVFALFYFVFEGNFQVGAYIRRSDVTEGLCGLYLEGLIQGGAYFRNFTV